MKTYLNVIGILAILGGVALALIEESVAYLGAGLLPSALCFALAKLIALAEDHLSRTAKHRARESEYWKLTLGEAGTAKMTEPKWYIANGQDTQGPFNLDQLRELKAKGLVTAQTVVAGPGETAWKPLASVLG